MELTVIEDTLVIYSTDDIAIEKDCIDLTDYATVEDETLVIL